MNLNLFLGQGVDGRNVYWANAENAHISILGQSGTGKRTRSHGWQKKPAGKDSTS